MFFLPRHHLPIKRDFKFLHPRIKNAKRQRHRESLVQVRTRDQALIRGPAPRGGIAPPGGGGGGPFGPRRGGLDGGAGGGISSSSVLASTSSSSASSESSTKVAIREAGGRAVRPAGVHFCFFFVAQEQSSVQSFHLQLAQLPLHIPGIRVIKGPNGWPV